MGLVTMMDGYLCPHCGRVTHQLLSPKLAMEKVAKDCGIPFLISIPQNPDVGLLKPYLDRLAKMVLKGQTRVGGPRLCWPICHHLLPVRFFRSLTTWNPTRLYYCHPALRDFSPWNDPHHRLSPP